MKIKINLGLLYDNNYFGKVDFDKAAYLISSNWVDFMHEFGLADGVDVRFRVSGVDLIDAKPDSSEETWFSKRAEEALEKAIGKED